jgi:hypothetical protein
MKLLDELVKGCKLALRPPLDIVQPTQALHECYSDAKGICSILDW